LEGSLTGASPDATTRDLQMVQFNIANREIILKIVYYGPALSGKTTNLQQLHSRIEPRACGKMISLDTKDDRTLYFDFLPVQFVTEGGFNIKMKLFTVPGQVMHRSTRKAVLAGADAIAFIADSQRSVAVANAYSFKDLEKNLQANGIDFATIPLVVQFNKRDLNEIKTMEDIEKGWAETNIPIFPAVAIRCEGVVETFEALIRCMFSSLDKKHDIRRKLKVTEEQFLEKILKSIHPSLSAGEG
jgi:signal recognition particle receptor subunit beta